MSWILNSVDPIKVENLFLQILDYCKNNNVDLNDNIVYNFLRFYGLKENDKIDNISKNVSNLFDKWIKKVNNKLFGKKNIYSYHFPDNNFCGFKSRKDDLGSNTWYKIYLPVDYEHLDKSVKNLIGYLNEHDEYVYDMKVAEKMRSDSIIIRVKYEAQAKEILNYIQESSYIQEGLNVANPMLPNINGVGIIKDMGGSYNDYISMVIVDFLSKTTDYSYTSFVNYLKICPPNYLYLESMEKYFGYKNEYGVTKKQETPNSLSEDEVSMKINCLFQTCYKTLAKYEKRGFQLGIKQLKGALSLAINSGDYGGFTNDDNARDKLKQNIYFMEIISIISASVNSDLSYSDLETLLNTYVYNIYDYYKQNVNSNKLN